MNKEQFLQLELKNISQVYFGKINNNGDEDCNGEYIETSFKKNPYFEINDDLVLKRLNRAKKLVFKGVNIDYWDDFIQIQTGKNKCLAFYLNDLK